MSSKIEKSGESSTASRGAGAFDVRYVIAFLFAVYGVVLVVWGLGFTTAEDLAKAAGVNINLWGGLGMLVFAGAVGLWAWLRPITVPEEPGSNPSGAD